jgi:hypothetical protein
MCKALAYICYLPLNYASGRGRKWKFQSSRGSFFPSPSEGAHILMSRKCSSAEAGKLKKNTYTLAQSHKLEIYFTHWTRCWISPVKLLYGRSENLMLRRRVLQMASKIRHQARSVLCLYRGRWMHLIFYFTPEKLAEQNIPALSLHIWCRRRLNWTSFIHFACIKHAWMVP